MVIRAGGLSGKNSVKVELGEVGDIGHEHRSIYDQVEPTASSP
jgi:hypothetical protein